MGSADHPRQQRPRQRIVPVAAVAGTPRLVDGQPLGPQPLGAKHEVGQDDVEAGIDGVSGATKTSVSVAEA